MAIGIYKGVGVAFSTGAGMGCETFLGTAGGCDGGGEFMGMGIVGVMPGCFLQEVVELFHPDGLSIFLGAGEVDIRQSGTACKGAAQNPVDAHRQIEISQRSIVLEGGLTDLGHILGNGEFFYGTACKGPVADFGETVRQLYLGKRFTAFKSGVSQVGNTLGNMDRGQAGAVDKGLGADGSQSFRQGHGLQSGAVGKSALSDGTGSLGNVQLGKAGTIGKRKVTQRNQIFGQRHLIQQMAVVEQAFVYSSEGIGQDDGLQADTAGESIVAQRNQVFGHGDVHQGFTQGESLCANGGNGVGQLQSNHTAAGESIISNGGQIFRKIYHSQIMAAGKGVLFQGINFGGDGDLLQFTTEGKGAFTDGGYRSRQIDFLQAAAGKSTGTDGSQAVGQRNLIQRPAAGKSMVCNGSDTGLHHDLFNLLLAEEPGLRFKSHITAAGDGQGSVFQNPGQAFATAAGGYFGGQGFPGNQGQAKAKHEGKSQNSFHRHNSFSFQDNQS